MPKIVCKRIEKSSYENTYKPKVEIKNNPSLANYILSFNIDVFTTKEPVKKVFSIASYEKDDMVNILYYIKARYKNHIINLYISRELMEIYRSPSLMVNDENMELIIQTIMAMPIDELKIIESKRLPYPIPYGGEINE